MVEVYDLSMKYEPFALKQLAGCKLWRFQKVEWINNCFHIVGRFNTAFENLSFRSSRVICNFSLLV